MLNIKVSLGYKQRTYMSHILPFIEFCADSYPDAKEITKEMLARKTVINSTQISHIIRHNNMAIFASLTLSDKNIACFQINILCFEVERLAGPHTTA